ncbi:MAG TPA: DUF5916 domain-containing protein [Rhodanobacteraceae bacterium]|nr:DUF5916 domain-containing protein [Rhodanobacteraceae bacterium]
MRGLTSKVVCALGLLLAASASAIAAIAPAPVTIPLLTPWLGANGKPTAAAWKHAARFAVNNEIQPGHNVPAPVKTEAFVGYTQAALWLRFVADDPHPAEMRVKYRQHDGIDNNEDFVGILFNPFDDTQFAYEFFCSAGGTENDALRQQNNEYDSWDAIWYCSAHPTLHGYDVVMEIPFGSLKVPHSPLPQTWRILVFRNWSRAVRHQITQVKLNYDSNCTMCAAEPVRTATPIPASDRNFEVIPSLTLSQTGRRASPDAPFQSGNPAAHGGIDARWAIRPDLELAATLDPNFSQVAPDILQPTVNRRFAIFYPENRPFFRRGTQVFNTPGFDLGTDYGKGEVFVDTRQIADPHWATKVDGQVGNNALGALVADDTITNILLPGQQSSSLQSFDFATRDGLARYRYDFPGNSSLGFLATDRQGGGYQNGLLAVDGSWQLDPSDAIVLQAARSTTTYPVQVANAFGIAPGTLTGSGLGFSFERTRNNYNASLSVARVSPDFRSDMGYLPKVGYTEVEPEFEYDWYSNSSWWNTGGFGAHYDWVQGAGHGPMLDRMAEVYGFVKANGQSNIQLFLRRDNQFFGGRNFVLDQVELDAIAQPLRWLGFQLDATTGDGADYIGVRKGRLLSLAPQVTLTPGRHLEIAFVGDFERLDIAGSRLYTDDLYDLRVSWYFNPQMFVRAIGQLQDIRQNTALYPAGTASRNRSLATQWVFGYVLNPFTSLFAGFSNGYIGTGDAGLAETDRELFLKLSYAFQL